MPHNQTVVPGLLYSFPKQTTSGGCFPEVFTYIIDVAFGEGSSIAFPVVYLYYNGVVSLHRVQRKCYPPCAQQLRFCLFGCYRPPKRRRACSSKFRVVIFANVSANINNCYYSHRSHVRDKAAPLCSRGRTVHKRDIR